MDAQSPQATQEPVFAEIEQLLTAVKESRSISLETKDFDSSQFKNELPVKAVGNESIMKQRRKPRRGRN